MTSEPERKISVYTFFAISHNADTKTSGIIHINTEKLTKRHDVSSNIIGSGFLAHKDGELVWGESVVSLAYPEDLDLLAIQMVSPEEVLVETPDPFLKHTATFFRHQKEAGNLPPIMLSAMYTKGKRAKMFLLVRHQGQYKQLLFNFEDKAVKALSIEETLNLLHCEPNTEKAYIDPKRIKETAQLVETASIEAVQSWLGSNYNPAEPVERICCVYLHPRTPRTASTSCLKEMIRAATRPSVPTLYEAASVSKAVKQA